MRLANFKKLGPPHKYFFTNSSNAHDENCLLKLLLLLFILVSGGLQNLVNLPKLSLGSLLGLLPQLLGGSPLLVEGLSLGLSLLFKVSEQLLVLPPDRVGEVPEDSEVALGLEAEDAKGSRDNLALHLVVGVGNSVEGGEASNGLLATGSFLVDHASHSSPEHLSGGLEVEGTLTGVGIHVLSAELGILHSVSHQTSADTKLVAPHNNDLLSGKQFPSHNTRQATDKVIPPVNKYGAAENHCILS